MLERCALYAVAVLAALFSLLPLLWALSTSLKTAAQVVQFPPRWWPSTVTLAEYGAVISGSNFARYLLNSLIVAGSTTVVTLALGLHAAYAAARFAFPAKRALLLILLATIMIPGIVVLVPLFLLASRLSLVDTYTVLIVVYSAWQLPTVVWFMRGFFEGLPRELDEAARVDGCSRLQAFYRVVLPLTGPGIVAAAILVFVWVWNEFILALTLTSSDSMRLIPVGLYYYVGAYGVEWGKLMAAALLAIVPVLVLFGLLQRHLIAGLTTGSVKG
jgi:multiple sugar transport system permease protein